MAVRKRRSKLLLLLLSVVLLFVVVIAALPVWFPWALRPIAKRFGLNYIGYRRVGYQRFELSYVVLTNSTFNIKADRASAFVPTVWLWKHWRREANEPFLDIHSWQWIAATNKSTEPTPPTSVYSTFGDLRTSVATLTNWVPVAKLTNGTISIQGRSLDLPQTVWSNGTLTTRVFFSNWPPVDVVATARATPWTVRFDSQAAQVHGAISIEQRENKLAAGGTINWLTNQISVDAVFPQQGFIPDTARLRADSIDIPGSLAGLPQYADLAEALHADWQTNHFTAHITARATPLSNNVPPLDVELAAAGDTNAARLETARVSAPGVHAELPASAGIEFHAPYLLQPTTLNVVVDLDQQHWAVAQGRLAGHVVTYPERTPPRVSFDVSGSGVTTTSLSTSNLAVTGELNWPLVNVTNAHVTMDDGSQIFLSGSFDMKEKVVRDGRLQSSGAFGGQFLPADYGFDSASIDARFGGSLNSLTNSATFAVKHVIVPYFNPMDVDGEVQSTGFNFQAAQIKVTAGSSSLLLRGSGKIGPGEESASLTALELSQSNRAVMRLEQPAGIELRPARSNALWALDIQTIVMSGNGQSLRLDADVEWPRRGTFQCLAQNLDARLLKDFLPQANREAVLHHFDCAGGWTNGPLEFQLVSAATLETTEHLPFSAHAEVTAGKSGILIEQFSVSSATQAVCRVEGSLPVSIDPTRKDEMLQIDTEAPLRLKLQTDPKSILWEKIAEATGLRLQEPDLSADLSGTWAAPQGRVNMRVERIELVGRGQPLPSVQNLDFAAILDRASAQITRCNFEIEQQPVSLTGQVPLGESFWSQLRHQRRLPDWREATGRLKMENARLAAFTPYMPKLLTREGTASADISLERGGNLRGELSLANGRTFPLESIGTVRNIRAVARLDGRTVRLENASAEIGGQQINADGGMELNEQLMRTNGLPPFHVHLYGTNVPLARNPSILLRADLDLTATNSATSIPTVHGKVQLRDSLYLADLQSLVPQRTASPRQRPPYFSVEAEPWAHWHLNVAVHGNGFLFVQTPLFQGKVSTVMTLGGTMKEPLALGQVKVDPDSVIVFPFSTLDVKQGLISLSSEDPYRPTLFVTAQSRRFGYDVKMEVTGPVDQPVVQFSSIPGLGSEDIVLMLAAGQIPRATGVSATTEQRAQGFALFVGKNFLSDFGLGGGPDRLLIRSGQELSETGHPTYDVEYKLTDRWSLIGQYDRFDQYNLNLKYRLYSK